MNARKLLTALSFYSRRVLINLARTIKRDAHTYLQKQVLAMSLRQFSQSRHEVCDIRCKHTDKSFIYLASHTIDLKSNGDFYLNVGGMEFFSTNLFDLEKKLYNFLGFGKL